MMKTIDLLPIGEWDALLRLRANAVEIPHVILHAHQLSTGSADQELQSAADTEHRQLAFGTDFEQTSFEAIPFRSAVRRPGEIAEIVASGENDSVQSKLFDTGPDVFCAVGQRDRQETVRGQQPGPRLVEAIATLVATGDDLHPLRQTQSDHGVAISRP